MMTAFAFILGVVPLVIASGAGAAARVSIGIAVFAGMLIASTVGLFFIPMLYVVIQSCRLHRRRQYERRSRATDLAGAAGTGRRTSLMRRVFSSSVPLAAF